MTEPGERKLNYLTVVATFCYTGISFIKSWQALLSLIQFSLSLSSCSLAFRELSTYNERPTRRKGLARQPARGKPFASPISPTVSKSKATACQSLNQTEFIDEVK